MRVLMVTPSYFPIKGGAESVIRRLSIGLNRLGVHVDILTFNMDRKWKPYWQGRIDEIDGATVYRIPALNWFPIEHSDRITMGINLIPGRFRGYLRGYDAIHFHIGDLTFPLFSYTVAKPKIAHLHGPLGFHKRYYLSRLILKNVADLYIVISKGMYENLAELGVAKSKIRYIPNAVDTNIFRPIEKKDENLILFVGRIAPEKGVHVLIKALSHLKTKTHLVIIGPSDWDTKYFQEMQNQIALQKQNGIHEIEYLGMQEQASVVKWCQKASLFVLPSFKEASPITILEALSCGTPVVATNIGGIPEVLHDYQNGILVPPNDSLKLADAIDYLLNDKDARTRFGLYGRKLVVKNFSYAEAVKNFCRIYEELT